MVFVYLNHYISILTGTFVLHGSSGISHVNPEIRSMLFTLIYGKTLVPDPFVFLVRITVKNIGPDKRFAFLGCNLDGWSETCELCLSTFFDIIQIHEECQDTSSDSAMSVFFDVVSVEGMILARLVSEDLHFVEVWNGYICHIVYTLEKPFNDWVLETCVSELYRCKMRQICQKYVGSFREISMKARMA